MTDAERTATDQRDRDRLDAAQRGETLPAGCGDYVRWEVSYKVQGWIVGEGQIGKAIPAWRIWNPMVEAYQEVPKGDALVYG